MVKVHVAASTLCIATLKFIIGSDVKNYEQWPLGFPVFQSADLQGDGDDVPLLTPCLIDRYHPNNGCEQSSSHSYLCRQRGSKTENKRGCRFGYIHTAQNNPT